MLINVKIAADIFPIYYRYKNYKKIHLTFINIYKYTPINFLVIFTYHLKIRNYGFRNYYFRNYHIGIGEF